MKSSYYVAIFTEGNIDDRNSTITLASGMTFEELNKEKSNTVKKIANKKKNIIKFLQTRCIRS